MTSPNVLFICSDEHTRHAANCYGSTFISSPNIDRLAENGTRYTSAYTNSPLCVPARASMITGEYVHRTGCWDNGHPYTGSPPGWAHRLRDIGYHTVSIGKNHFRSTNDDNGFDHELLPMHVRNGVGDLYGMLRRDAATYPSDGNSEPPAGPVKTMGAVTKGPAIMANAAGAGETNHTRYDRAITAAACDWLRRRRRAHDQWALYVSFVAPHFPLIAPGEFYDLYPHDKVAMPLQYSLSERPRHPVVKALSQVWNFDDFFDARKIQRARAGYYGLISFLDSNIGQILKTLDDAGLTGDTFIVYTSDHGEMLGNKGIWSTSALYEESVGVPLILAGPGVASGQVVDESVSHIDLLPTLLHVAGDSDDNGLTGCSLLKSGKELAGRHIFSEYHAGGSITGCFMLRMGRWKYHHYVGFAPELFDLSSDAAESTNLGTHPAYADVRARCEAALHEIVDPNEVNARAFEDQAGTIDRHGGAATIRLRGHPGEHSLDRQLGLE
jgi:choline-sulfatase